MRAPFPQFYREQSVNLFVRKRDFAFLNGPLGSKVSPGRDWRPLIDTTNQPTMSQRLPVSWVSWQRNEDYYQESLLIWLDADTTIRKLSHGQKSPDDYCKLFYSMDNGSFVTRTCTLQHIEHALNQV